MEYLLFLLLVLFFIVMMTKLGNLEDKVNEINNLLTRKTNDDKLQNSKQQIENLFTEIKLINKNIEKFQKNETDNSPIEIRNTSVIEETLTEIVSNELKMNEQIVENIEIIDEKIAPISNAINELIAEKNISETENPIIERDTIHVHNSQKNQRLNPTLPKVKPKATFFDKNPDLEKFIGENLINKIGIAILVFGIGFFVKFAIDQNWIGEVGRVLIGILCGAVLVGIAHYLRKTFTAFSSVLIGGGIAIFYFTIALAFREYAIISQAVAFIIMIIITLFAIAISILYDRQELAIISIIGGFVAPLLVSSGSGNYIVLFSYLLILVSGMLVLAYFKKWTLVTIVSYGFTILFFTTWLLTKVIAIPNAPNLGAIIFAFLFYVLFFLMNIINSIKESKKMNSIDLSLILSNTALFYSAGMGILANVKHGLYQGLFTGLIAFFNLGFTYFLFKRENTDRNLLYLLIGIVLTFISLAAPIQLNGNYITMFWSFEAVLLLWLAQKSSIQLFKLSSIIVLVLMLISLIMDWNKIYSSTETGMIIINKGFITGIVSIVAIYLYDKLIGTKKSFENEEVELIDNQYIIKSIGVISLYIVCLLEIYTQLNFRIGEAHLVTLYIGIYNYTFLLILTYLFIKKLREYHLVYFTIISIVLYFSYLFYYQLEIIYVRDLYLNSNDTSIIHFLAHYLLIGILICNVSLIGRNIFMSYPKNELIYKLALWLFTFLLIFISSSELEHLILTSTNNPAQIVATKTSIHKIGFPILWGIGSFIMMLIGMKHKIKTLRIISLSLFALTILKLIIFDLRNMSDGGKIGAFISLGVILLTTSFLYQKLKKIISDDETDISEN